jgi:hypothetical protein
MIVDQGAADGMHQVGLAHAHAAIDEQRIIAAGRVGGDGPGGGVRELVAGAHHEAVERELGIERADRWRFEVGGFPRRRASAYSTRSMANPSCRATRSTSAAYSVSIQRLVPSSGTLTTRVTPSIPMYSMRLIQFW